MEKKQSASNQRKQAFLASVAMLLVSALVITTASFAWFTLGRSAQVNNLNLKVVKEGEGIAISANAKEFTDTLTVEELMGTATGDDADFNAVDEYFNYFPERISPASSEFAVSGTTLPVFFTGGVDLVTDTAVEYFSTTQDGLTIFGKKLSENDKPEDRIPDTLKESNKAASFYEFDIFVKNSGSNAINVKTSNSKIIVDAAVAATDTSEDSGKADFYDETVKSMRIGFVNCGTVTEGSTAVAATKGESALIFADTTSEDAAKTLPVKSLSNVSVPGESDILHDGKNPADPEDSKEIHKNPIYSVPESKKGTITLAEKYACPVDNGTAAETPTMTLNPGVTQIRVYIWMEGQDANCTNELMSQYISANVCFTIV